jgi:formylglycine-generating enzyme required for sulfatase activity
MVWCNAATEWYKAKVDTSYKCVYKYEGDVIRDSRDANATACDNAVIDSTVIGFRLLSSNEWELAARYRADLNNDGDINDTTEFYPGNYASGANTYYNDITDSNPANGVVDGKDVNDTVAVYGQYWNGSWVSTGVTSTALVKSKIANAIGIYDISGNVWEWCFDRWGIGRKARGGSWLDLANSILVSTWNSCASSYNSYSIGFRIARNI